MKLDMKTEKLVAISASVAVNCLPCIKHTLKAAKDSGATEDEIRDEIRNVIKLAKEVKTKSYGFTDKFAEEILSRSQASFEEECHPEGNNKCCCEVRPNFTDNPESTK